MMTWAICKVPGPTNMRIVDAAYFTDSNIPDQSHHQTELINESHRLSCWRTSVQSRLVAERTKQKRINAERTMHRQKTINAENNVLSVSRKLANLDIFAVSLH